MVRSDTGALVLRRVLYAHGSERRLPGHERVPAVQPLLEAGLDPALPAVAYHADVVLDEAGGRRREPPGDVDGVVHRRRVGDALLQGAEQGVHLLQAPDDLLGQVVAHDAVDPVQARLERFGHQAQRGGGRGAVHVARLQQGLPVRVAHLPARVQRLDRRDRRRQAPALLGAPRRHPFQGQDTLHLRHVHLDDLVAQALHLVVGGGAGGIAVSGYGGGVAADWGSSGGGAGDPDVRRHGAMRVRARTAIAAQALSGGRRRPN